MIKLKLLNGLSFSRKGSKCPTKFVWKLNKSVGLNKLIYLTEMTHEKGNCQLACFNTVPGPEHSRIK